MKNLFDYATKELSQDAFICWFIANCNDETVGEYSYSFINFLTGMSLKRNDIKEIEIKQQAHNIDIIVDFWLDEKTKPESHYVMIIEDKTTSSAHSSQLKKYAARMDSWNTEEPNYKNRRYKIFYKVDHLTDKDNKEIALGNEEYDENDRWKVFDIDKIYGFFSKIKESKSEILNSYVEHINALYKDLNEISSNTMRNWNFANYETFFRNKIKSNKANSHFECWQYQGRLVSAAYYYHPQNEKLNNNVSKEYPCIAYPLVEFVYRKNSKKLLVYTHITFHWFDKENKEHWNWKYSRYEPDVDKAKDYLDLIKTTISNKLNVKVRKMASEKDQTISVDEISLENKANNEIQQEIQDKLDSYFDAFEFADK